MSASALRKIAPAVSGAGQSLNEHFVRLSTLVTDQTGIRLPAGKRTMLEGRLRKRMRAVGAASLDDYCRFLFEQNGLAAEITHLVDAVTTNKTDFFREPEHFEFLCRHIVPDCLKRHRGAGKPQMSSGARPPPTAPRPTRSPWCSPISLAPGANASTSRPGHGHLDRYPDPCATRRLSADFVSPVPADMQRPLPDAVARPVQPRGSGRARVAQARSLFRSEPDGCGLPRAQGVDVIFLRNVLICYLLRQADAGGGCRKMLRHLRPNGFLILGHSETMIGRSAAPATVARCVPTVVRLR